MTITVTDLFCGAGGSSIGAERAGATLVMAANHWQTAIDVHQANFPNAAHDCADVSQADPRRYPRTDILLASPECTNHSQARGVSRKRQDASLWDAPDPAAERSRSTMWDVIRFAEQMHYAAMVVENVVEATKWILWPAWVTALTDLGYEHRILSHNSMFAGVPQSRDRIYIACWRRGLHPDLELEQNAWCPRCDTARVVRQGWKPGRSVGRYRQQWQWHCTVCSTICEPSTAPAASIIDWPLPCPKIGERTRPLADATRARILAGLQRYGWAPIVTAGAGNVYETTPGNRARPVTDPLPVQQTTATTALVDPPDAFLFNTAHGGRTHHLDKPHPTVCASDDRLSLIVPLRNHGEARSTDEAVPTVTAGGNHHALLVANTTNNIPRSTDEPVSTVVAGTQRHALVMAYYGKGGTRTTDEPLTTQRTRETHALIMRNNTGGPEMCTPVEEPVRSLTTAGHQSLLTPADPIDIDLDELIDLCGFRMLEPHEIAAAMAFPAGYIPLNLPKKDQVKLAGNAVTPPSMTWPLGRLMQALEGDA